MARGTIAVQHVVSTCRERAAEFRNCAKSYKTAGNRDLELQYEGMALAADRLADEFEAAQAPAIEFSEAEIDTKAKELDPSAFANFQHMLERLRLDGVDEGHALRSAQQTYGPAIESARQTAKNLLEDDLEPSDEDQRVHGFEEAVQWHEARAREADMQSSQEQQADRKLKLRQRADRHRLYARHLRAYFEEQKAAELQRAAIQRQADSQQQSLPLGTIPLDVQLAFLKRTDNIAGEAFD